MEKLRNYYKTFTPPDIITAFFSLLMSLLILSRIKVLGTEVTLTYVGCYMSVLLFILLVVPMLDRIDHILVKNPLIKFIRNLYPAFLLGVFFGWTEPVSHMFFAEPFDQLLLKADYFLLGFNPGRDLASMLGNNYYLSEYMNFSYLAFYFTPWLVLYFYFAKKQREFYYAAFVCAMVMYSCFFLQSVFPAEGPIYNDPTITHHIIAGPISAFAANFLSGADVPGSAMPSGHIAGTISILFLSWQMFRKAFWVTLPLWTSLCISTVYGHFHYAIDGIAGIFVATVFVFWLGPLVYNQLFPNLIPDSIISKNQVEQEDDLLINHGVAKHY